jgi:citrate synthase
MNAPHPKYKVAAVQAAPMFLDLDASIDKAIRLIARVASLVTDGWRILQGQDLIPDKPDLSHAGNFFYKLTGSVPELWQIRMLDTIYILYADHEFNASTFAARQFGEEAAWRGLWAIDRRATARRTVR